MSNNRQKPAVVMITGASAGVGRATAIAFARRAPRSGCWLAGAPALMAHDATSSGVAGAR